MANLIYPCGCKFQISNPSYIEDVYAKDYLNQNIPITYDIYNLPDCKKTWELFAEGNTRGVFQLEKGLGKSWSKKMKPEKLEDLSALVSILRPGVLNSGYGEPYKSVAQHFVDKKNLLEDKICNIKALEPLIKDTHYEIIYQESMILIAKEICGFSESEADTLRRGVGKKLPDVIAKLEEKFVEGALKIGKVTKEEALQIFDSIRNSARYAFNKCLSPTTIIESNNGYKLLSEVQIGEYIKTPEGFCEVLDKINCGNQELYEITLESGKTIQCTLEHKFLCEDNQKHTLSEILEKNIGVLCDDGV